MEIKMLNYVLPIILIYLLPADLVGDEYPPYVQYRITVIISGSVTNVDETNTESVTGTRITVWVQYLQYNDETGNFDSKTASQIIGVGNNGKYYAWFDLLKVHPTNIQMGAELSDDSRWLVKDESDGVYLSTTEYTKDFEIIPLLDDDKNGIRDDFEWDLVKIFCPSLVSNLSSENMLPMPIQFMCGEYNTKFYVTWTDGVTKHEFRPGVVPIRADLIDYAGMNLNFKSVMKDISKWGKRYDFSNEFPVNPITDYSFDHLRIWNENHTKAETLAIKDYPTGGSEIMGNSYLWIHYDWPGSNTNDWYINYRQLQLPYAVYSTIWRESNNLIAIQYWFFYPYDDWANDHEGDWEHINVLLSSQFIDKATINKIQFYFHYKWKEWPPKSLRFEDNTHVIVYIGGSSVEPIFDRIIHLNGFIYNGHHSNGSYPDNVRWQDVGSMKIDDDVHGWGKIAHWYEINTASDQPQDGFGLELIKDPDYWYKNDFFLNDNNKYSFYSWVKTNIYFGEPSNEAFWGTLKAFSGPTFKKDWRKLGGFGTYEYYK